MADHLRHLCPNHEVLLFPAWDCLPYDRVSPNAAILAERMTALAQLASGNNRGKIVVTTVNAIVQKTVPPELINQFALFFKVGEDIGTEKLIEWANVNGYLRVPTVREQGEFAVRGGLVDLFRLGLMRRCVLTFLAPRLKPSEPSIQKHSAH